MTGPGCTGVPTGSSGRAGVPGVVATFFARFRPKSCKNLCHSGRLDRRAAPAMSLAPAGPPWNSGRAGLPGRQLRSGRRLGCCDYVFCTFSAEIVQEALPLRAVGPAGSAGYVGRAGWTVLEPRSGRRPGPAAPAGPLSRVLWLRFLHVFGRNRARSFATPGGWAGGQRRPRRSRRPDRPGTPVEPASSADSPGRAAVPGVVATFFARFRPKSCKKLCHSGRLDRRAAPAMSAAPAGPPCVTPRHQEPR